MSTTWVGVWTSCVKEVSECYEFVKAHEEVARVSLRQQLGLQVCVCVNTHQCVLCDERLTGKGVCRWCLSSANTGFKKRKLQTLIFTSACSLMYDNKHEADLQIWDQKTASIWSFCLKIHWSEVRKQLQHSAPSETKSNVLYETPLVCVCLSVSRYLTSCHTPGGRSFSVYKQVKCECLIL